MTKDIDVAHHQNRQEKIYQIFKYSIYLFLFFNIFYWLREDYIASSHTFLGGVGWEHIGSAFAQSMDTIAWFVLLFAFEFETYILSDKTLNSGIKWILNIIAVCCYILIFIAFLGYTDKLSMILEFGSAPYASACEAVGHITSYVVGLDDYATLTIQNCSELSGPFYINTTNNLLASADMMPDLHMLAWAETINAGVWILIVLFLWIDIFIQLRGMEHGKLHRINLACKTLLYLSLIVICVYWGFKGDFMDFWDAFLWIVAFFFIELNVFKWAEEIEEEKELEKHEMIAGQKAS